MSSTAKHFLVCSHGCAPRGHGRLCEGVAGEHRTPSLAPWPVEPEVSRCPAGERSARSSAALFAQKDFSDFVLESAHQTLGAVFFRGLDGPAP